jgi:uncharacterized membrane protein YqjE
MVLGKLIDSIFASLEWRIKLFSLELQEEKYHLIKAVFWVAGIIFCAALGLIFLTLTIVYLCGEAHRALVLSVISAVYLASLVVLVWRFKKYLHDRPAPFSATLDELRQDRTLE